MMRYILIPQQTPVADSAAAVGTIPILGGGLSLDVWLGLAGVILALSVAVQTVQEIYKYLTTSKARAYRKALGDFLQIATEKPAKALGIPTLLLRGPFQWRKKVEPVHLLPMDKDGLIRLLITRAPVHVRDSIRAMDQEAKTQGGKPAPPSPVLRGWLEDLWSKAQQNGSAREIFELLAGWGLVSPPHATPKKASAGQSSPNKVTVKQSDFDAAALLEGLQSKFLHAAVQVRDEFEQFSRNFEFAYGRRNFRQTIVIGFLLALALNLPLLGLYRQASSLTPEQLANLAQSAMSLQKLKSQEEKPIETPVPENANETVEAEGRSDASDKRIEALLDRLGRAVQAASEVRQVSTPPFSPGWDAFKGKDVWEVALHLLQCFATALLVAFGAPFWDRLSSALLGLRRSASPGNPEA